MLDYPSTAVECYYALWNSEWWKDGLGVNSWNNELGTMAVYGEHVSRTVEILARDYSVE